MRAAKEAHHGCQVYEGKKRKKGLKTTMSFRSKAAHEKFVSRSPITAGYQPMIGRYPAGDNE